MVKLWLLLILAPLIVLGLLIPINALIHQVIVPTNVLSENQAVVVSLLIIAVGLICGLIGLFTHTRMRWYFKLLIVLMYIPAVMFSLIISGM